MQPSEPRSLSLKAAAFAALGAASEKVTQSMEAYRVKASGPNTACQLLQHLGVANVGLPGYGKMRSASHTKRGPGRRFTIGDGTRTSQQRQAGAYGRGLMNWVASTQAARSANRKNAKKRVFL